MSGTGAQSLEPIGSRRTAPQLRAPQWLALLVLAIALSIFWSSRITGAVIKEDAAENLRMALNLKRIGVMSNSTQSPFRPSMFREPLPVITNLLTVYLIERALGPADDAQYFQGERAKLVKEQNIFWLGCLSVAVFLFVRRLTPSFNCAFTAVVVVSLLLLGDQASLYMLDSLYTETPAAVLLIICSLALSSAVSSEKAARTVFAGLCLGLLALVKAAFLFVAAGIVMLLPCFSLLDRQHLPMKNLVRLAAILGAACLMVVTPWMYRNYRELGVFGITTRGGEALYFRALMDQMNWEEYFDSFAFWAPYPLNGALRRLRGISREDIANGSRLLRLNDANTTKWWAADRAAEMAGRPQDAYSFHRLTGAEREKLVREFTVAGQPDPYLAADRILGRRAMQMLLAHPLRHLANTVSNLWRGAFFSFPLLLIAIAYAWRRRDIALAMLMLPALGMVMFYALLTPFLVRYGLPELPIAACIAVVLGSRLGQHILSRLAKRQSPSMAN